MFCWLDFHVPRQYIEKYYPNINADFVEKHEYWVYCCSCGKLLEHDATIFEKPQEKKKP